MAGAVADLAGVVEAEAVLVEAVVAGAVSVALAEVPLVAVGQAEAGSIARV